jgi:transposase InsO family protein
MPWREMSPMGQRLEFIREYASELFTLSELAAQYGISRKTAYKWLERFDGEGEAGVLDRSRRPHRSPQATAAELVRALIELRRRHPRWGARKLLAVLRRGAPHAAWPARSTVCELLKRRGLVVPPARRCRAPASTRTPLAPITAVNEVWTTDFKGEFRTGDRRYCYPLTLRDGWSRFVLRCDALVNRTTIATRTCFERAFAEYGLPERIRSDNGGPFASPGLGGLSQLSVWWLRLGIVPERIAPGHPEQNGSHEHFHGVLKAETARPPASTARAQQRRFARFCTEYNYERPHEALHDQPPATRYESSRRVLPRRLPPLEYPSHAEIRLVATNGCLSWDGAPLFIATALAGQHVAFEEVDDGIWTLYFGAVALARFDQRQRRIHPIAAFTEGRSAASAPQHHPRHDGRQAPTRSPANNGGPND